VVDGVRPALGALGALGVTGVLKTSIGLTFISFASSGLGLKQDIENRN